MDSTTSSEIDYEIPMLFQVYKDGRVERYRKHDFAPPSDNPIAGVRSKDVVIVPENNVSVRLYLPKITQNDQKFPLLVYFHGGAFVIESAFSTYYDSYLHSVAAETNVLAVSVEYRLAPEHKIPACYDDSWAVMKWVAQHANSDQGTEPWLKRHADFSQVFLAGDSAGANIAHNMMMRASVDDDKLGDSLKLVGMVLIHPYFGNNDPERINNVPDRIWSYCCPESPKSDDPRFNPAAHPDLLSKLVCSKILICTAEKDFIRDRGWAYYEALMKCGWEGDSAGANIAHNMMIRASVDGDDKLGDGVKLVGMALIHPYFGTNRPADAYWLICCPENAKTDDPRFNPAGHPKLLTKLVCSKILICTAEKDKLFRDVGWKYYEALKKCGWKGEVEVKESEGEGHVFHLVKPTCEQAKALMNWLTRFFH